MSLTITDPTAVAILGNATGIEVEIRGPNGQLLGRFTPAPRPGMHFPELGITDEEMERRANEPDGWVSAAEVEARLRALKDAP